MSNPSFSSTKEREVKVTTAVENMLAEALARQIVSQIIEAMEQQAS